MSDRTDWLRNLSTEELLFMHKAYDVINQRYCQMLCIGDGRILVEMID